MFAHTAAADYPGRDWGAPRGATAFEGLAGKRSAAGKGGRGANRLDTLARLCALSARDDGIMFGRMKSRAIQKCSILLPGSQSPNRSQPST
jgi:hypothetical protein